MKIRKKSLRYWLFKMTFDFFGDLNAKPPEHCSFYFFWFRVVFMAIVLVILAGLLTGAAWLLITQTNWRDWLEPLTAIGVILLCFAVGMITILLSVAYLHREAKTKFQLCLKIIVELVSIPAAFCLSFMTGGFFYPSPDLTPESTFSTFCLLLFISLVLFFWRAHPTWQEKVKQHLFPRIDIVENGNSKPVV